MLNFSDFWSFSKESGDCRIWLGAVSKNRGYGIFETGGERLFAHRIAYELTVAPLSIYANVRHTCSNKICVSGKHLYVLNVTSSHDPTNDFRKRLTANCDIVGECFIWRGLQPKCITLKHGRVSTPRAVYKTLVGDLTTNQSVERRCGNNNCLNPLHLFAQNDSSKKMCEESVIDLRLKYQTGEYSLAELAKLYKITRQCAHLIVQGKIWKVS